MDFCAFSNKLSKDSNRRIHREGKKLVKRRVMTLLLALLLIVAMHPVSADAASKETQIKKEITSTYQRTLSRNGMTSLNGWCGLQTSWAMYLLGINKYLISQDGRDQFDTYRDLTVTTGGYRVKAYPAEQYSLEEALNVISCNGTRDAYNILVGFQWTNTAGGKKYGHACFINAILDGNVYFTEGFSVDLGGRYQGAGTAMIGTIAEFCESYGSWTRYEGSIHFIGENYQEDCEEYPTNLYVQATEQAEILTEPGTIGGEAPALYRTAAAGERLHATCLYKNKDGGYYYEITEDDGFGYINAEKAEMLFADSSDFTVSKVSVPSVHTQYTSFALKAELTTRNSSIGSVLIQISQDDVPVLETEAEVNAKSFQINQQKIRAALPFSKLKEGDYSLRICASVQYCYVQDGKLVTDWETIDLWNSCFTVMRWKKARPVVTYDPCGGTTELNQEPATELTRLPDARREGYTFAGWYTDPLEGTRVTAGTAITEDTTLYAHWTARTAEKSGWVLDGGTWYYYEDDQPRAGWLKEQDIQYYLLEDGAMATGWAEVEGVLRYFSDNGAMRTGWVEYLGDRRYLLSDGAAAQGWLQMDGKTCYFDEGGFLHTGWLQTEDAYYYLDENGSPWVGEMQYDGMHCWFDSTGALAVAVSCAAEADICYLRSGGTEEALALEAVVEKGHKNCKNSNDLLPAMAF